MPRARTESEIKKFLLSKRGFTSEGCWYWLGSVDNDGYGSVGYEGITWKVHRLSLRLFRPDEFRESYMVLHKNECTSRLCFNPEHLYSGNNSDNMQDSIKAGTHFKASRKYCPKGHDYTPENTYINPSNGGRVCRICMNMHNLLNRC